MTTGVPRRRPLWDKAVGLAEDAVLLLILVLVAPLVILLVGTPIVLCVRAAVELLGRL